MIDNMLVVIKIWVHDASSGHNSQHTHLCDMIMFCFNESGTTKHSGRWPTSTFQNLLMGRRQSQPLTKKENITCFG